jgi:prephenate dehydrogenase
MRVGLVGTGLMGGKLGSIFARAGHVSQTSIGGSLGARFPLNRC